MARYPGIDSTLATAHSYNEVVPLLIRQWLSDYDRNAPGGEIVQVSSGGFSYLFDITHQRLIAAWGVSQGKHSGERDKARMAGHPLSAGKQYHRGHAIPHTLGGPTDINLVPQLGSVNVGPFRRLEREAVATPGSLYFTHWRYRGTKSQVPVDVEQGLLLLGSPAKISLHAN